MGIIDERRREILSQAVAEKGLDSDESTRMEGRDLLTVMSMLFTSFSSYETLTAYLTTVKSSLSSEPSQQLRPNEILCQISTFIAAGM